MRVRIQQLGIFKKILYILFFLFSLISISLLCLLAYITKDLPDITLIDQEISTTTTKIYDHTGDILLYEYGNYQRIPVTLEQVPDFLQWATLAIEDYDFYRHPGFSIKGIGRSVWSVIFHKQFYGSGSTITQQLIKNALLSPERSFMRKAKEIILAIQLEQHYTKHEILEKYFNAIPYGGLTYGCAAAAKYYFNKDVSTLSLAENAFLAGLPAAPSYFSPFHPNYETTTQDVLALVEPLNLIREEEGRKEIPVWKKRQAKVLLDMAFHGYINADQAAAALAEPLSFQKPILIKKAPHFVDYVQQQLVQQLARQFDNDEQRAEQYIKNRGLVVITSLEWDKQQMAEEILEKYRGRYRWNRISNAALVAIRPAQGTIAAMVGSFDYYDDSIDGQVNVTISSNRQVGSSIKPLVYGYALERGETAVTLLNDTYKKYYDNYIPHNYDRTYHGKLYMRTALANSYNLPALDMIDKLGVSETVDFFHTIGITTIEDKTKVGLAVALGATEIKLLDLTYAFSVFANQGVQVGAPALVPVATTIEHYRALDPVAILKIIDHQGNILVEYQPESVEIMRRGNAFILTDILSDYAARAPVFGSWSALNVSGYRVAGKTGTASDLKDITTLGYYPKIAVGVWCGNNDGSSMRSVDGVSHAAPIWNEFIRTVIEQEGYAWYEQPPDVTTKYVYGRKEYFLVDNIPKQIKPEQRIQLSPSVTLTPAAQDTPQFRPTPQPKPSYYIITPRP